MSAFAPRIAAIARRYEGDGSWLYYTAKDNFPANSHKCNKFVYDVIVEAGVKPPPTVPATLWRERPPLADEWANPRVAIPGWAVVTDGPPKPGDVVAEGGHCGIVVGNRQTASANSLVHGVVTINDWGFRESNKPTFRRCIR